MSHSPEPTDNPEAKPHLLIVTETLGASEPVAVAMDARADLTYEVARSPGLAAEMYTQTRYDLVLLDTRLAALEVPTAACEIRRIEARQGRKPAPIIAMIDRELSVLRAEAIFAASDDHLDMPLCEGALEEVLEKWLGDRAGGPKLPDVHASMIDLIPGFLARRREDIVAMRAALSESDFAAIRHIAHKVKGSGGSFGFPRLSEIGGELEIAAQHRNLAAAQAGIDAMARVIAPYG